MAYQIEWTKTAVTVTLHGEINIEELDEANGKLHGDARIEDMKYNVWDFLDADLGPITKIEIEDTAAIDMVASRSVHKMKVALAVWFIRQRK